MHEISIAGAIIDAVLDAAKKNNANVTPEYSTWKPATISVSLSAISNGKRLVSAMPEIQ